MPGNQVGEEEISPEAFLVDSQIGGNVLLDCELVEGEG